MYEMGTIFPTHHTGLRNDRFQGNNGTYWSARGHFIVRRDTNEKCSKKVRLEYQTRNGLRNEAKKKPLTGLFTELVHLQIRS
ncbi:hypothetical protein AC626_12785 [Pseudoalteromonas rubra]|uniref:Uncharacterized protein n=1 Tax=Pseudoalteromonas rubra TaxID=43658 RepID=A0A0L0ETB6_9GAMM|nr:hypothetical protein AC626_12785 [Pseudoalteromonas rubra]